MNIRVGEVTLNNHWCSYCSNQILCKQDKCKLCRDKSFQSYTGKTIKGKLKYECIDITKNNISPLHYYAKSDKKIWFMCDNCDHQFCTVLGHVNNGKWCPYCSSPPQKMCHDDNCIHCYNNSLASFDKKTIMNNLKIDCWDYKKNKSITPRHIFKNTGKKYWFICDICQYEFQSAIYTVTGNVERWCPNCKHKTEKKMNVWLNGNYEHKILHQHKFKWCKSPDTSKLLPFDFCIEELKTIIEIDGPQHFEQIHNWDSPENIVEHDKFKMQMALKNGYTVIRIYQVDIYNDKNNWEAQTIDAIKKNDKPTIICIGCQDMYLKHLSVINEEYCDKKKYKCETCDKLFKFKGQLQRHNKSKLHLSKLNQSTSSTDGPDCGGTPAPISGILLGIPPACS